MDSPRDDSQCSDLTNNHEANLDTSDNSEEPPHNVQYKNEKNIIISSNLMLQGSLVPEKNKTITDWDIVTNIKLMQDVKKEKLPIEHVENFNEHRFFCKPSEDPKVVFETMIISYNQWREQYNKLNGFRTPVQRNLRNEEDFITEPQKENEEIDLQDINDFPELDNRSTPSSSRTQTSSGRSTNKPLFVDIGYNDPDDQDFIPVNSGKKNKKNTYKLLSNSEIFDFEGSRTVWGSSKNEEPKKYDSKNKKNQQQSYKQQASPPQPSPVKDIQCPLCSKLFAMNEIEAHASDCSVDDADSRSIHSQSPIENLEDAILISDESETEIMVSSPIQYTSSRNLNSQQGHKSKIKRDITNDEEEQCSSPSKKIKLPSIT